MHYLTQLHFPSSILHLLPTSQARQKQQVNRHVPVRIECLWDRGRLMHKSGGVVRGGVSTCKCDGRNAQCQRDLVKHIARHTSHVTHHTSHVTRHTSHVIHHTSHVTRHTLPASRRRDDWSVPHLLMITLDIKVEYRVTRHMSHVTRHTSHVTRHTSHVTRHTSHVTRHMLPVTRHTSHVTFKSARTCALASPSSVARCHFG